MSKRFLSLSVSLCLLLFLVLSITMPTLNLAQAEANSQTTPVGIPISRKNNSVISNNMLEVFGPQNCIDYGDPFSPLNSVWEPGIYTHTFQIRIPVDYPDDVVRVELFDPDSVNQVDNNVTIKQTSFAINTGGLPFIHNEVCGSSGTITSAQQRNLCVFETGELNLVDLGNAEFDQINPFWFKRVDKNRGSGGGNGDGTCNNIDLYEVRYNTETNFKLYYVSQTGTEAPVEVLLASYVGFMDDPVRDDHGDHQTDLRWVSPGADKQSYDYPIPDVPGVSEVPTTEGNSSFEVKLADVPNIIVDLDTGERFFYLDVTTLSGASGNAYHIWAGPDDYVDSSATDVNERNIAVVNNPDSHDSKGVQVEAVGRMIVNNIYGEKLNIPIGDFSAEDAGGTIYISAFDLDAGFEPPITFYWDSINKDDWSMTFSEPGVDDPDGVTDGTRCNLGGYGSGYCNNVWITPAYQIEIPGDFSNCDFQNLTAEDCTPFAGGRLMADINGSTFGSDAWEVTAELPTTVDTTQSCAAFPIAVSSAIRSVTEPGSGANPYPNYGDFDYPTTPPVFDPFLNHPEANDLASASVGTVFKASRGFSYESGNFGWLKWNLGIAGINGSGVGESAVLSNSLIWPGDSLDYANHSDPGAAVADAIPHVVRGYVKLSDVIDQTLTVGDWVSASPAQLPEIETAVNSLIDSNAVLRMIVWDSAESSFGLNGRFTIQRFALFKIIGYGNSGADDEWLLLEFMGFDDSCGQLPAPPPDYDLTIGSLNVVDSDTVRMGEPFTVTATITNTGTVDITSDIQVGFFFVEPVVTLPPPIGYESIAGTSVTGLAVGESKTITLQTNQGPSQIGSNQLYAQVDSLNYVNETNEENNVVGPLVFQALPEHGSDLVISDLQIIEPENVQLGQPFSAQVTISNTGTVDISEQFFVDFYLNPSQINPLLAGDSVGYTAVSSLPANSQKTITITISGGTNQQHNNTLYAKVDSFNQISEADETNNETALLNFDVLQREWFIYLPFITQILQ